MTTKSLGLAIATLLLVACAGDVVAPQSPSLGRTDFDEHYVTTLVDEGGLRVFELRSSQDDRLLATLELSTAAARGEVTLPDSSETLSLDITAGLTVTELHRGLLEVWWAATNTPETTPDMSAFDASTFDPETFDPNSIELDPAAAPIRSEDEVAGASAALHSPRGNLDAILVNGHFGFQRHDDIRMWAREAYGWSFDPDVPGRSVWVHFYSYDTRTTQWAYAGATPANRPRRDVNSRFGISGNHGFHYYLPDHLDGDGPQYGLFVLAAYGIDRTGDAHSFIGAKFHGVQFAHGRTWKY